MNRLRRLLLFMFFFSVSQLQQNRTKNLVIIITWIIYLKSFLSDFKIFFCAQRDQIMSTSTKTRRKLGFFYF